MNDPFTEVATQVATNLISSSMERLYSPLSDFITVKKAQYLEGFSSYCKLMHQKNSMVRTLYAKTKPMPLKEVYVKTQFTQEKRTFSDLQIISLFSTKNRIIIKGNGGSGKTIFLKHLWLSRFEHPQGRIPIFVELRRLNDLQSIDILSFCRNELQSDMSFGKGVFEKLCENGKFEFIFDGFDEVNKSNRRTIEKQIISMSEKYHDCCFLVSGREDDRFSSWGSFQIYSVAPLAFEDVQELINKIPFDKRVKKKFLETLNADFYRQHKSFLSSPLLACMMLMTFNENAIIPSKLTEFYKSAFQTLLTWHDATKDSFERDRSLSVDEFRRVFSTFCLASYHEQVFEFDEDTFRRFIQKSLTYHGLKTDVDDVKNDICESANLIQKDGLKFLFVHRSFQEYFAAECAMLVVSGKAKEFLEVFSKRQRDAVFAMCFEIHPELVFDYFFQEKFDWLRNKNFIGGRNSRSSFENLWILNGITVEAFVVRGNLQIMDMKIEWDEDQKSARRIIRLASDVSNSNINDSTRIIFDTTLDAFQSVSQLDLQSASKDIILKFGISFSGHAIVLKIRNLSKEKVSSNDIAIIRRALLASLEGNYGAARKLLLNFHKDTEVIIAKLEAERREKEKSIDDILGMG